jgi:hypothetical protein
MKFFQWVRSNSERYLLEAAQRELAKKYLGQVPPPVGGGLEALFWRRIFVPIYGRIPWSVRRAIIIAMPGSHRRDWGGRAPPEKTTSSTANS